MKFGLCTSATDYGALLNTDYDYIELRGREICTMKTREFNQLCHQIHVGGLPCLRLNSYCPPSVVIAGNGFSLEEARGYARLCANRAYALGVKGVGIGSPFSRNLSSTFDKAEALHQAEDFFKVTSQEFNEFGITVCIEALAKCFCNFINQVQEAQDIVTAAHEPNLRLLLDFYNMEHENEDAAPLEDFMSNVAHIHMSDDDGSPFKRSYLRPDKEQEHINRIHKLINLGYDGTLSVEIDVNFNSLRAQESLQILRRALHYGNSKKY